VVWQGRYGRVWQGVARLGMARYGKAGQVRQGVVGWGFKFNFNFNFN